MTKEKLFTPRLPRTTHLDQITELIKVDQFFKTIDRIDELFAQMMKLKKGGLLDFKENYEELVSLFSTINDANSFYINRLKNKFKHHFNLDF